MKILANPYETQKGPFSAYLENSEFVGNSRGIALRGLGFSGILLVGTPGFEPGTPPISQSDETEAGSPDYPDRVSNVLSNPRSVAISGIG